MLDEASVWCALVLKGTCAALPLMTRPPGRPPLPTDDPDALLLSERRRAIVELVQKQPGISLLEVQEALNIGAGVFFHHLDKLVAVGLVERRKIANTTHLYPGGAAPPADAPALAQDLSKEIARLVLDSPGLSSREMAQRLARPVTTVRGHLRRLLDADFIKQEQTWSAPIYHPTPKLRKALETRN